MPSPFPADVPADRPATEPPGRQAVDALITQARRLRGGVDAVRRAAAEGAERADDPRTRWQRALCELAAHQLAGLDEQLGQLRDGLPPKAAGKRAEEPPGAIGDPPPGRVGSAEWNLLTDDVTWSDELFELFGRRPADGALTLDELPSWLVEEDTPLLTALVTDCLVDGKPIDGEFRVVRPDGSLRTLHMLAEPVLDTDGCTATMWAVLRDVSELRRSREAVDRTGDALRLDRQLARAERHLAVELQEAVLPPWYGSPRLPGEARLPGEEGNGTLDLAARYLPSPTSALVGGDWFDALPLPDGRTLLSIGGLAGHGVTAASTMAVLLGAVRGMAVAGAEPGPLMGWLNQLLDASAQPALGSAVCCRYDPRTRALCWSQAGHPAPLLFRDGTGRALRPPQGVLLGAVADATYAQAEEQLLPGDVLLLHTDGLSPRGAGQRTAMSTEPLLELAPRFAAAKSAQECVRTVLEELGGQDREDDACVLVARIGC